MGGPLDVPHNFAGMHFHKWPEGNPVSPRPSYGYGTVRSHDYGIAWNSINTAPGMYHWDRMDTWVRTHAAAGKTLIYTLYGTPAWISTRPSVRDAYGQAGAGSPPRTYEPLAEFINALLRRYNMRPQSTIQYLEVWNEPHFMGNDRGFWWGTANDLAELCRTVAVAARNADAGIKILSPGFDGLQAGVFSPAVSGVAASLRDFLAARDSTGQSPGHLLDGIAIHTYNAHILTPNDGIEGLLLQARGTLQHIGLKLPIYVTESGYFNDALFTRQLPEQKGTMLLRQAAVQAGLGGQCLCFYAHDDEYCGNPSANPAVAAALDDVQKRLAGQRLQQVTIYASGEVGVQTAGSSFLW